MIQTSISLKYEPASEPPHIFVKSLFRPTRCRGSRNGAGRRRSQLHDLIVFAFGFRVNESKISWTKAKKMIHIKHVSMQREQKGRVMEAEEEEVIPTERKREREGERGRERDPDYS